MFAEQNQFTSRTSLKRFGWIFLIVALVLIGNAPRSGAEIYLTPTEAQKLCFPNADHFDAQELHLSEEQIVSIERRTGVKVRKKEIQFWRALRGQNLSGFLITDQVFGKHELIDYAVALSKSGTVLQVEVLQYRERYGSEIRSPKWRSQFSGKNSASALKLNEDIYNISGATISCRHVVDGVKRIVATYEVVGRSLFAAGGVPDRTTLSRH